MTKKQQDGLALIAEGVAVMARQNLIAYDIGNQLLDIEPTEWGSFVNFTPRPGGTVTLTVKCDTDEQIGLFINAVYDCQAGRRRRRRKK